MSYEPLIDSLFGAIRQTILAAVMVCLTLSGVVGYIAYRQGYAAGLQTKCAGN